MSAVSAVPELRAALLERQRALAAAGGIVMAGRDIGTVVLPDADLKLFLDASVEERARRRAEERGLDPAAPEADAILEALRRATDWTRTRAVAPLRPAADARIIATDGNRFEDTVDAVVGAIRDAEARRAAEPAPGVTPATTTARPIRGPIDEHDHHPDRSLTLRRPDLGRPISRIAVEGAIDESRATDR